MKTILVDSGAWVALKNRKDKHHEAVLRWLEKNAHKNIRLATTWVVLCESFYLIKYGVNFKVATSLFHDFNNNIFDVFNLDDTHTQKITLLLNKYEDNDIDLADVSLVIAAEHFNTGEILTVDENDFDALRWGRNKKFKLLLRE